MIKIPKGRKRETARKVRIKDLNKGEFFKKEGFTPNYILTPYGLRVSRARLLATIVNSYQNEDGSYGAISLDDGSDTIRGKFFQDLSKMEDLEEGDIVDVAGKVKLYNDEIYIVPELITKKSPNWELLRALEYKEFRDKWKKFIEKAESLKEDGKSKDDIYNELKAENLSDDDIKAIMDFMEGKEGKLTGESEPKGGEGASKGGKQEKLEEDSKREVLKSIEENDSGEGTDYSEILENVDLEDEEIEDIINNLLSDGTCYEPRPGKIKKL